MAPAVGTTHHVKLGAEYLILRANTYQKSPAPTFGARISTGDPDYNNLSLWQHWVQKCWVGGMGAPEWVDDAMFKEGVGLDTTEHEKVTLSRHLLRGSMVNGGLSAYSSAIRDHQFVVFKTNLYVLQSRDGADSQLWKYTSSNNTWTQMSMPGSNFYARAITVFDGALIVGGVQRGNPDVPRLYWSTGPLAGTQTWTTIQNPAGIGASWQITSMRVYNSKLYVCYNTVIWRMKDTYNKAGATLADIWDGGTQFYKVNSNANSTGIIAMETHLGFLYMLSSNGHLHRTDGNNSFDIWSWDGQTAGVSLRSYDGKLFVGTYEYTDTSETGDGVLYQFTGAAVTELKRWGKVGRRTNIGRMIVQNRRLFYGASSLFGTRPGFGVACYDAIEDGHSIFAVNDDAATYTDSTGDGLRWIVNDIVVFGGKMYVATMGHGIFFTEDSFKAVEEGRAQFLISTQGGGTLTSSQYDGGTPGLEKLWRRAIVWCDLPVAATTLLFEYSVDGGVTWVATPVIPGPAAVGAQHQFYFNNLRSTRFQYRITLKTTDQLKSPTLFAVSVSYLPQPEPNWSWSFVVPVTDKWELLDGSEEAKDTNALIAYFEALFRSQQLVSFTDIDGKVWAPTGPGVLIYDINIIHYDIGSPREADLRFTVLETVESYG